MTQRKKTNKSASSSRSTRSQRRSSAVANRDEQRTIVAIHLQRAATDLHAARIAIEKLETTDEKEVISNEESFDRLAKMGHLLKLIHNRYSHIKMP